MSAMQAVFIFAGVSLSLVVLLVVVFRKADND